MKACTKCNYQSTNQDGTAVSCDHCGNTGFEPESVILSNSDLNVSSEPDWKKEVLLLRAEIDRLRELLRPFAEYAARIDEYTAAGWDDDTHLQPMRYATIGPTFIDCRRAAEALQQ